MPTVTRTSIALLAALVAAGAHAQAASAGEVVARVDGPVRALALTADGLVLARQPDGSPVVVERRGLAGGVTVLGRVGSARDQEVAVAAAGSSVVVGIHAAERDGGDDAPSPGASFVATPTGLATVASCADAVEAPAVATDGVRVAFMLGGCRVAGDDDDVVTPASLAVEPGGLRLPLGTGVLTGAALTPGGAGASSRIPSLLGSRSAVQRVGAPGDAVLPTGRPTAQVVGAVADGRLVVQRSSQSTGFGTGCSADLAVLGERTPRILDLGSCVQTSSGYSLDGGDLPLGVVGGSRAVAAVQSEDYGIDLATVPVDGLGVRVLDRSSSRAPLTLAATEGRVAWTRLGCDGRTEVVLAADAPGAPASVTPDCTLNVAGGRAPVVARAARLAVRCVRGCTGTARDRDGGRLVRFRLAPGRDTLRLPLGRRAQRLGRVRVDIDLVGGREQQRTVRLRTVRG